jgi:drug/metabolite transporter (DMT)-like permease
VPIQIFIGLTLCNLVWSAHPILGKILLEHFTSHQVAWLRYSSALFAYWVGAMGAFLIHRRDRRKNFQQFFLWPRRSRDRVLVIGLGFLTFCFSPLTQLAGLELTFASENSVIIAMEPLITAVLAWVLLKERLNLIQLIAFLMALVGFVMLSGASLDSHGYGNFLILISMLGEASYSVLGRKLTQNYSPLGIFGSVLLAGVLFLTVALLWMDSSFLSFQWLLNPWFLKKQEGFGSLQVMGQAQSQMLGALIWLGPLGTTVCYFYYMQVLKEIPVLSVVLFLFLQPVFGTVWGMLFLHERLGGIQILGSCMIFFGLLLPYAAAQKRLK